MSVIKLRKAILENCDILQALLAFNYRLTRDSKDRLDEIRTKSPLSPAKDLRIIRESIERDVEQTATFFGCLRRPGRLVAPFIAMSRDASSLMTISKAAIDSKYFSNFCGGIGVWKGLPPHLRLVIDFNRITSSEIQFDYILTEAMLYEDMALAYNEAMALEFSARSVIEARANMQVKKQLLFLRTATLSAFYFVEAYLNGIGYDYYYRHESDLSDYEKTTLLEWDSHKNRSSWVSFERKVMDYPKIMLRARHPPLTAANSKNLKILGDAKEVRDAIVHQSPKTDDVLEAPEKVFRMLALNLSHVTEIVDAAVAFVGELNGILGAEGMMLDWLSSRDRESGLFPPESFT